MYKQLYPDSDTNKTSGQLMALARLNRSKIEELQEEIDRLRSSGNTSRLEPLYQIFGSSSNSVIVEAEKSRKVLLASLPNLDRSIALANSNEEHAQLYRNNLLAGQRVIVVAHSQGNLFANHNVGVVVSEKSEYINSIGIVGVASPAIAAPLYGDYVTALDDDVINALRQYDGRVLAGNIQNDLTDVFDSNDHDNRNDDYNHAFITSYLQSSLPSRPNIEDQLYTLTSRLTFPEGEVGAGAIRATLQWGSEPDVDLHVFEPDGDHVYYSNSVGSSGELDLDDTSSFGPENYFVPCDKLQEGTYRFAVNYFSGENPENARLQLTTADGQLISTSRLLSEAVGSDGDGSPITLISLDVAIDSEGKVTYSAIASSAF